MAGEATAVPFDGGSPPQPKDHPAPAPEPVAEPVVTPPADPAPAPAPEPVVEPVATPPADPTPTPTEPQVVPPAEPTPPVVEESFEISSTVLPESELDRIAKAATDGGWDEAQTKALVADREALYIEGQNAVKLQQQAEFDKQKAALEALPEYAPDKIEATRKDLTTALDALGVEEFKTAVLTGDLGNRKDVSDALLALASRLKSGGFTGKGVGEIPPIQPAGNNPAEQNNSETLKIMYPAFFEGQ